MALNVLNIKQSDVWSEGMPAPLNKNLGRPSEKTTNEQKSEGSEGMTHENIWRLGERCSKPRKQQDKALRWP